jgi:hypothetical protein
MDTIDLPKPETALYNHPLPKIEMWLRSHDCEQDANNLNLWHIKKPDWQAELSLDVEQLTVRYLKAGADQKDITRAFKYSLSRQDIEAAVFSGP